SITGLRPPGGATGRPYVANQDAMSSLLVPDDGVESARRSQCPRRAARSAPPTRTASSAEDRLIVHTGISLYFLSFTPSRNLAWMLLPLAGCLSQCAFMTCVPLCMMLPGTSKHSAMVEPPLYSSSIPMV